MGKLGLPTAASAAMAAATRPHPMTRYGRRRRWLIGICFRLVVHRYVEVRGLICASY